MDIEALALKYRPKKIEDIVGQAHVVTQLKGILKSKRIPNTILLTGPSGTGKTTISRIIARYVNCKTFNACGECASCKYEKDHPDVTEMNMADTRGIDDIRNLVLAARNMPSMGGKRVFIIDEIHGATSAAVQALLKPLEEPPARTLWILATTNPEKLPATILGRCLRFSLSPISEDDIVKRLYRIAKREGTDLKTVDEGVAMLKLIANLTNGQMRDSIQMLESLLFAVKSGDKLDGKKLLQKCVISTEADLDKHAAQLLVACFKGSLPDMVKTVKEASNARGLLSKTRWLIDNLISDAVQMARFKTLSARLFAKAAQTAGIKVSLSKLLQVQFCLVEAEARMNFMPVDEGVLLLSHLGNLIKEVNSNGKSSS